MNGNVATPSGFLSFIGKVGSDWHSRYVKSSRDLERSQQLLVTYVCECACVNASALSVENVSKVSHFLPSFRFPDGAGWNGRHGTRRAWKKTWERSSTEVKEWDERKSRRKKEKKNILVKISLLMLPTSPARRSKYQNARMRTGCGRKSRWWEGKREKYSREEKSNPLQCISEQAEEGGALACGERKSRFEKMKFVPWRILVSIFTVCMCSRLYSRTRFPRFRVWLDYFYRAFPGTRDILVYL